MPTLMRVNHSCQREWKPLLRHPVVDHDSSLKMTIVFSFLKLHYTITIIIIPAESDGFYYSVVISNKKANWKLFRSDYSTVQFDDCIR
ncbi:hypothetical protein T4A_8931 [Trichinella pseudospiralis]|uniref:Uncharacterized protein n=1 Tax=Trichinella pseudospiralis TaxID=6337 RepID=A0A0V1JBZ1_TRIPS|nr:hypothetical protein T4A_8931 [Trichinella pseudospiralis]KRZ32498.1 hypothetical protein T4C_9782 [Trichinella pseudospiralis]